MGIADFIRKIFKDAKEQEIKQEKIHFSDIERFLKEKIEEAKKGERQVIYSINQKADSFITELRGKIRLVNEVDIGQKEKNEKVKTTVYEGRKKYTEFLEKFIEKLRDAEKINELNKYAESINSAFLRLNENSRKSYERATILIGKEMGEIKETLKKFSNELLEIFNENKEIIPTLEKLHLAESKINENKEIREKLKQIREEIKDINNKISDKEKELKELSEKIDKIKNSQEHKENLEKIRSVVLKEEEIKKEIPELRQFIDFKSLSNFFHIFEDKMAIVKAYRDDFLEEFNKDRAKRLLNLLDESKLNSEKITDKLKRIQDKEEEVKNMKKEIKKDEAENLLPQIEGIKEGIKELADEKERAGKKEEKLEESQQENLRQIKEELNLMNIILEEEPKQENNQT